MNAHTNAIVISNLESQPDNQRAILNPIINKVIKYRFPLIDKLYDDYVNNHQKHEGVYDKYIFVTV